MNIPLIVFAPLLAWTVVASAAPPKTRFVDASNANLIAADDAKAVMAAQIPARVWRVYPASKYAFASQVEGGLTPERTCVVAARVMVLPLTPSAKAVLFRPRKVATAYDAIAAASVEQCRALARDKLKEATAAVVSSIVRT